LSQLRAQVLAVDAHNAFPRKDASETLQLRQTLKRLPQELFKMPQHNEVKGFISGHVHMLTTSIQEALKCEGFFLNG
jgi:hypothetical protein